MTNLGLAASDLQAIGRDNAVGAAAFESTANRNCPARLCITGYSQLLSGSDDSDLVGVASSDAGHSTSEIGPFYLGCSFYKYASEPERFRAGRIYFDCYPIAEDWCGSVSASASSRRCDGPGATRKSRVQLSASASPPLVTFVFHELNGNSG